MVAQFYGQRFLVGKCIGPPEKCKSSVGGRVLSYLCLQNFDAAAPHSVEAKTSVENVRMTNQCENHDELPFVDGNYA